MRQPILTIVLWAGVAAATASAAPKIQFDKTAYDFGSTSQVQRVEGKFTVRNTGDAPLKIEPPASSCGCIQAGLKTNTLSPGEQTELVFTVSLAPFRQQIGKHITVTSNDPQTPKVDLGVRVEHIPLFDTTPAWVAFDHIRQGATTNATVQVKRTDGKKLTLTKAVPTTSWITAKVVPPTNADPAAAQLALTIKPEGPPRRFGDIVRVFTEDTNAPAFNVNVQGRIVGDVLWSPEMLYWFLPDPSTLKGPTSEALLVRRLSVQATSPEQPVEIQNAMSTLKELNLEVAPKEKGKSYELVVRLMEVPATNLTGNITFETGLAKEPKVTVPVTINVAKKK